MMPSDAAFLKTLRIRFRSWEPEDLPLAIRIWADPLVTRLVADLGNPSPRQAEERLTRELANRAAFGVQYWPIFTLDQGELLGCCGLRPYRPEERVYEIGAHILPAYWRSGYATEALRAVSSHAFGPLGVAALFARHNPHNHGSARLMDLLGFAYTHDEFMPTTGLMHPCYLLRSDGLSSR